MPLPSAKRHTLFVSFLKMNGFVCELTDKQTDRQDNDDGADDAVALSEKISLKFFEFQECKTPQDTQPGFTFGAEKKLKTKKSRNEMK